VVAALSLLAAEHPLREHLVGLLMTALHRCHRRAEALAIFHRTRTRFADELGVDPGTELQRAYQEVLADRAPDPFAPPEAPPQRTALPAQLPAAVADFTGRASFVNELGAELATAGGRVMVVSAVAGIGGIGKTSLAVQVAHAAREHFPDGQLYVDLQGAGPAPAEPGAVLGIFLRSLGRANESIPEGVAERAALYRSLLDGRRILILLDNARDAAQIRHLLPGTSGCATLITSRHRMLDLAGGRISPQVTPDQGTSTRSCYEL
jgi:hypothetical protein